MNNNMLIKTYVRDHINVVDDDDDDDD